MSEREFYEMIEDLTAGGNCDRCSYGLGEDCHLQCNDTYEDYIGE